MTREHILRECLRYEEHLHLIEDRNGNIDIAATLGTRKGIAALKEPIEALGAFTKTGRSRVEQPAPR
jgi:hypothetical protein